MEIKKFVKSVWDEIVNAEPGAKTTSVSLTAEHAEFLKHTPPHFLRDTVREVLTKRLESELGYLDALERKVAKEYSEMKKQKPKASNK